MGFILAGEVKEFTIKVKLPFQDRRPERRDPYSLSLPNEWDIPVRLCANDRIQLAEDAVDELLGIAPTQETIERLLQEAPGFLDTNVDPPVSVKWGLLQVDKVSNNKSL
ncbi:hypothetical protein ACFL2Q_05095 [Thermodesulfobacteriota bacterium]